MPQAAHSPPAHGIRPALRRLRPDLRLAARDGAFALAFQARRGLADHLVTGAEAQLRWPSRHHGMVQSSFFMPVAEACGLTETILAWTLEAACQAARDWPEGTVCVAVPPRTAHDGTLLTLVAAALARTRLPPGRLEVALPYAATEADSPETLLALAALRDLGLGVSVDDFGRAGACLLKLKRLPLTAVKLDCSLVRDVPADRAAAAMLRATIGYAHALDMKVVAAGVETEAQLQFLRQAGCDAALERLNPPSPEPRLRQRAGAPALAPGMAAPSASAPSGMIAAGPGSG